VLFGGDDDDDVTGGSPARKNFATVGEGFVVHGTTVATADSHEAAFRMPPFEPFVVVSDMGMRLTT
jgi:hypothetical protein